MPISLRALLLNAGLAATAGAASAAECIAPEHPGGDWDFICRQVGEILFDIGQVGDPIQVTNMAGSRGGLALAQVLAERADDPDLIVGASQETVARLAKSSSVDLSAGQVRFLGAIGADPGVIVVAAESPFRSLADIVDVIKADPASFVFAGGSPEGGFDHLNALRVLKAGGVSDSAAVKYVEAGDGADAASQTIGGVTQAMIGVLSEVGGFLALGDVRALAVLSEERVLDFQAIPTAKEQGFDVVAVDWRGFYVPKGISDAQFDAWAGKLQAVAESAEWQEVMAAHGLAPFTKVGADFQSWVDGVIAESRELLNEVAAVK